MARDFYWISSAGVQTKLSDLQHLAHLSLTDSSLNDFNMMKLNKAAAIVTFRSVEHGWEDSQPVELSHTCHTSVWVNRVRNS